MLSVYLCTWRTGAVTFYVDGAPNGRRRVVSHRERGGDAPEHEVMVQLALRELKLHLDPTARPNRIDDQRTDPHFVWFPSLNGHVQGIGA